MERRPEKNPQDRRTRYTRNIIKETLLESLLKKRFEKISVTEICKQAEINRGTFYLHYLDTYDVLDDLINDFLSDTSDTIAHVSCPNHDSCTISLCEKIHSSPKYHPLFLDDTAAAKIQEKLIEKGADSFISYLMQNNDITQEQAESVFVFQINGCLSVNRMMLKKQMNDWPKIQKVIDRYIGAGLKGLIE